MKTLFDFTSYFVTVGLSNTVQLRLLVNYPRYVGTLGVSFVLPGSTLLIFSSVLSRCKAVLFNLRVPSLTKSDLCKDAGVFHKLSRFQLLSQYRAVSKVATSYELVQSGLTEMTKVHRQEGAGGAPPFVHFSSFREMNWEEREAARAERNAAATEAQTERKTAAAEQRRLMVDVFELKPYLAEGRGRRSGFARGEPWTAGSRGEPKGPIESAVQSGAAAGGDRITYTGGTAIGLESRIHVEPMRWMGSDSAPSPARTQASTSNRHGDGRAVPVQKENGENQVKQIKYVPLFDGAKAKFPA